MCGIHFYEIWPELDNTIGPFGLSLILQLYLKTVLSRWARKAIFGIKDYAVNEKWSLGLISWKTRTQKFHLTRLPQYVIKCI